MKLLTNSMMIVFLYFPLLYAQEVTTVETIFPDYELSWQIEDTSAKGWVYIGEDYFGVSTPFNQSGCIDFYKHYTIEGELLWTSTNIDNDFWNIEISRSGNRIIVDRRIYNNEKFQYNSADIYDKKGKLLFTSPKSDYLLDCTPNGIYFFTKPGGGFAKLILLDSNGKLTHKNNKINIPSEGLSNAIDDSLLLIYNFESLLIFNMNSKKIELQNTFTESKYTKSYYSPKAKKILLWQTDRIEVYDTNLSELANFNLPGNLNVFRAQISNDSKTIALLLADLFNKTNPISVGFFNLDGNSIDQANYNFPTNEKIFTTGEISFDGKTYIHRYTGANRITKEKLRYRSTIFTLDSETKKTAAQFTINSWLYHTINDDKFSLIRRLCRKHRFHSKTGSTILPIKSIDCDLFSLITKINGRSTRITKAGCGGKLVVIIPTLVTAAASVPFSSTLTNVLCFTSLINSFSFSFMPEKSAFPGAKATSIPIAFSASTRDNPYSSLNFGKYNLPFCLVKFESQFSQLSLLSMAVNLSI